MSDNTVGESAVSSGGIRGTNSPVPVMQRQVETKAETPIPAFGAAFTALAFTPDTIGQLGASMSLQAGVAIAKSRGQSLGKNPEGDLLPAITDVDKAFVNSYSAQAEATLGLQAQALMSKGQEELAQANRLTPGLISSYNQNMAEGLEGILQHAPSTVRGEMENQYSHELMSSSHQLSMSMISQNKAEAKETAQVYSSHQMQQMHDAQLDGNSQLAQQIYETSMKSNSANLASGQLTPLQAEANNTKFRLNYLSGIEIQKALAARQSGKLEGFLSGMIDKKPKSVSWSDWENVRNNTVSYIGAVENLDNRDQSLILSQANAQSALGPLNENYIAELREELTPTRFNTFMSSYISKRQKGASNQVAVNDLVGDYHNPEAYRTAKPDQINQAFDQVAQAAIIKAQNNGVNLSQRQAELESASTAGVAVPKFVSKLNLDLQSGNPQLMMNASEDLQALTAQNGQLAQGVQKQSYAMSRAFQDFLHEGYPTDAAAQMAKEVVFNKNKDVMESNEIMIGDWRKKTLRDPAHTATWARNMAGISSSTSIDNPGAFYLQMKTAMEDNMRWLNGDVQGAEKMLRDGIQKTYGTTRVNGSEKFVYMPIEKVVGLESGATPLIQEDIYHQVNGQIKATKAAYDSGNMSYYYRLKDRVTLEQYTQAKLEMNAAFNLKTITASARQPETLKSLTEGTGPAGIYKSVAKQRAIVKQFEAGSPIEVEMVHRGPKGTDGPVESYQITTESSPFLATSSGEDPVIGDYDLRMTNGKGNSFPLTGVFSGQQNHPVYRPDARWIRQNYFRVNGINPTTGDSQDAFEAWKLKQENPERTRYRGIII